MVNTRKPMVAGNWKMNKTVSEAVALVEDIKRAFDLYARVDVVVCPPFTALAAVSNAVAGTPLGLGAQNMHAEKSGAFTGEISAAMLRDLFCHYVILGHSERRQLFHETDELVNRKTRAALDHHLHPIVCVGETLDQRKADQTEAVLREQVEKGLAGLAPELMAGLIIAYEPVWAIGTGMTATPKQAQDAHAFIRGLVKGLAGDKVAAGLRILYGGSVKPANAKELFGQPDIDGGLIGGASLDADSFVAIVKAAL
jgi:triosephosphate isomerase